MAWCIGSSSSPLAPIIELKKALSRSTKAMGTGSSQVAAAAGLSLAVGGSTLLLLHRTTRRKQLTPHLFASSTMSISDTARKIEVIQADKAPKAAGPYSLGIKSNNLLFMSGQVGFVPETGKLISDSIEEQTEQTLKNIGEVLKASGASYSSVVKATVLLADIKDFNTVNKIYAKYFLAPYPARTCYQAAALPVGAKVEIECIAAL
ncbi:reactive Intermediate Deaminase A, chloroplastic isoform X1 [Amborella trichopoda]|uniref:reactive Intermediate Deaminase A, chloroplastic isoform X1 n=1 Tax=Amborella trichopoda TaxID=13333 RepID=UPI0005D3FEE4|nr:reactive Intermediate Deaminase A, chloroplastic isoform X1 [Amborella trichopoda]|eukprot:XP_011627597.1 reactive Intermediate Deaminase A, chloroplastic isoform X1 [Amborella trichopoda]